MGLSAEKKRTLNALYDTWGIDKVRRDLQRHYHPSLLSTEVNEFARAWVNAKDAKGRRRELGYKLFRVLFFSILAGLVVAFLAV